MNDGDTPHPIPASDGEVSQDTPGTTQPEETSATATPTDAGAAPVDPSGVAATSSSSSAVRPSGPLAARGLGVAKPASPHASTDAIEKAAASKGREGKGRPGDQAKGQKKAPRPRLGGEKPSSAQPQADRDQPRIGKVAVPNRRGALADDIQAELDAQLADTDIESFLSGPVGMPDREEPLEDGVRVHGQVLKIHDENVYVSLGGPDEGAVPFEQFKEEPAPGSSVEVIVRGINNEDGLYILSLPGGAVDVTDWEDIEEGSVVDATVTGHNAGGLECKVGGVRGFIPISQVTEYRIEDLSEFADQRLRCVVTEANAGRGNLVLSRRAVLEREREERKKEQLEKIQVGDSLEGTVRSLKDFGAFVDLGGCEGLIHISKLSWDRVKHPKEILEEGQKVQVVIEKIDKETGRIGLSYRDLLENPWDTAETDFAVGSVHKGTVTRIATFGCFVKLGAGIEGLVHISELAHHRVSRVDTMVSEGQEIDVKVLAFDRDAQKIGLSVKAAQSAPIDPKAKSADEQADEPPREPAIKASHSGPLKGGNNRDAGGEKFGLRW